MSENILYELSVPGRRGVKFPELDVPEAQLPEKIRLAGKQIDKEWRKKELQHTFLH